MQTLNIYEHEIIKDELLFFVSSFLRIKSKNRIATDIKQFSFNNEKHPFLIIWALEWLYCNEALKDYVIHSPINAFPDDLRLNEYQCPPSSYVRSIHCERLTMIPEHVGRMLDKYPDAIDKARCSLYVTVNHTNLDELISKNVEYFKVGGGYRTSELSYKKQKEKIIDYINKKFTETENPIIHIRLNDPELKGIDVVRTLNAMSFENAPEKITVDSKNNKLITIFDTENKRDKWVNGIDDITMFIRNDYLLEDYIGNDSKFSTIPSPVSVIEIKDEVVNNIVINTEEITPLDQCTIPDKSPSPTNKPYEIHGLKLYIDDQILQYENEKNVEANREHKKVRLLLMLMKRRFNVDKKIAESYVTYDEIGKELEITSLHKKRKLSKAIVDGPLKDLREMLEDSGMPKEKVKQFFDFKYGYGLRICLSFTEHNNEPDK